MNVWSTLDYKGLRRLYTAGRKERIKRRNMTARIFLKLIFAVLGVLVLVLTAVDFLASQMAETTYIDTLRRELFEKSRMLAVLPPSELNRNFQPLARAAGGRLTIIAHDGRVIADS